ncbi:MAG: thioredoxin family protein [Bacteroidales bacterium]|nr:thioredoxin family protein [Bacteroidales bacterium]
MKRLMMALAALFAAFTLSAQDERFEALGAKLEEYFAALAGDPIPVQNAECDFLIESCQDSLTRQFVALKIYDHYLKSKIMGDDGVAVHIADAWFIPGKVAMHSDMDLLNAKVFAEFNRQAQLGAPAPEMVLRDPEGNEVSVPSDGEYTLIYFYDTSCSTCRIETPRLVKFLTSSDFHLKAVAVYVGSDASAWQRYRTESLAVPGLVHAWDPDLESDFQRKYGVLQTPRMFLVAPDGTVVGRGLDTPALQMLADKYSGKEGYVYGTREGTALYEKVFAGYGDDLKPEDVLDVASYVAERTYGEGDTESFRHMEGDLLYFLSSQTGETFKEGTRLFIDKYILGVPDVWNKEEDASQVVSMAVMMKELLERTPVGSTVPDLKVHGTLLRKPCLFRRGSKDGVFSLRKADYLVFYTVGCGRCEETLAAARTLADNKSRVLLVNMDTLLETHPDEARLLLDTFDLSGLPYTMQLGPGGVVLHRYLEL